MVDKTIGNAYPLVKRVHDNLEVIKYIAYNMEAIISASRHGSILIDDIRDQFNGIKTNFYLLHNEVGIPPKEDGYLMVVSLDGVVQHEGLDYQIIDIPAFTISFTTAPAADTPIQIIVFIRGRQLLTDGLDGELEVVTHTHIITDVTGLQAALDALDASVAALEAATIGIADVTGLQTELTELEEALATAATLPIDQSDVTGLVDALAAAAILPIAQADVTGLVSDLAGKAASSHTHTASQVTGRPFSPLVHIGGVSTNSEEYLRTIPPACSFPAGGAGSQGNAGTAATASTTYSAKKNGSAFATLVFGIGSATATVTLGSATSFNGSTDVLTIDGPATADATLANIGLLLAGTYS